MNLSVNPTVTKSRGKRFQNPKSIHDSVYERLARSELFQTYQNAFLRVTGLHLTLVAAQGDGPNADDPELSQFCNKLKACGRICEGCLSASWRANGHLSALGSSQYRCFAGLTQSAVPVVAGPEIIAYLKTDRIFTRTPTEREFNDVLNGIGTRTLDSATVAALHDAFFQTTTVEADRYDSMVMLLLLFARQLTCLADSLATIIEGGEAPSITKARHFIAEHYREPLSLGCVSHEAGMSGSHFCRVFRESTGFTLTDYVNRYRIEQAKHELLKAGRRVSEIAFENGFQSLSQFNRSFSRLTGMNPSAWRERQLGQALRPEPAPVSG